MVLLEGKGISKSFGGLSALANVHFTVSEGELLGLIGPNGAGKTTLFDIITGVTLPSQGKISFDGEDISCKRADVICRKGISRTYQLVRTFQGLTVLENALVGRFFGSRNRIPQGVAPIKEVYGWLEFLEIQEKANQVVDNLSMADRKKVEIARALATSPKLLLIDEVMAGLNPTELKWMMQIIQKIREKGITVLMIEHQMRAVMNLSDRVLVLHHGNMIAEGAPQEVVNNEVVIKAYLGE
jgi:branched-chain amino acid transport system ATP-binding protein